MSLGKLAVTLIDVGSGDSIFIEAEDANGQRSYALVDSNDEPTWKSTETFLLRHFRNNGVSFGPQVRLFDFVMISHAHSDHMSGVKRLLQTFGAEWFYYPESGPSPEFATLMKYVRRSSNAGGRVGKHQVINRNTKLPNLRDVSLQILWPPPTAPGVPNSNTNENDNSIVLGLSLDKAKFLLTGDCEATSWPQIVPRIRKYGLKMFKAPHHGAYNGFFDGAGNAVWLSAIGAATRIGLSTHISPYGHPDNTVIAELEGAGYTSGKRLFRTDKAYHITFETIGSTLRVKHSRF